MSDYTGAAIFEGAVWHDEQIKYTTSWNWR